MNIYYLNENKTPDPPAVIAIGNFDGVHLGHKKLLEAAIRKASQSGGNTISAVFTFTESPRNLLDKSIPPAPQITSPDDKIRICADNGIERAFIEDFLKIKDYSPEEFIDKVLIKQLNIKCAVCGFDFKFGRGGSGDSDSLKKLLAERGIETIIIPPVIKNGRIVSSTAIRALLADGETEQAAELLGHPFFINFPVVYGKQLGRTIGIPTINQNFPENHVIPKRGIYACTCTVGDDIFLGVANVGVRPTVADNGIINCETHIINYNGMLYGKRIKVEFYHHLRDEMKFSGIEQLKAAISNDIQNTIIYFSDK